MRSPAKIRRTASSLNSRLKIRGDLLGISPPLENCPCFPVSHFRGPLHASPPDFASLNPGYDHRPPSKQRRDLPDLDRSQKHRAIGKAQRERAGFLALQLGFLAERVDAGGGGDIDVLLHRVAETGDRAIERAEQVP